MGPEFSAGRQRSFLIFAAMILLPLGGSLPAGNEIATYLEFPQLTGYAEHAGYLPCGLGCGVIADYCATGLNSGQGGRR